MTESGLLIACASSSNHRIGFELGIPVNGKPGQGASKAETCGVSEREGGRKPSHKEVQPADLMRKCIEEGMRNVLGDSGMQAVLFHLQLVQYAKDPKEFHDNLYALLKDGAITLEKIIVKELLRRVGIQYDEREAFDFERQVNLAREVLKTRLMEGITP